MPTRVSPTEQIRASIDALFADPDRDLGAVMEDVARLSVRLVFQSALEAEVTEFLGRDRYARGERAREGSRNGYSDITVKTTAGPVDARHRSGAGRDAGPRRCGVEVDEFKDDFWAVFDDVDAEPGEAAVAQARRHAGELAGKWQSRYPGAVARVIDDLDHLVAYLRFPKAHWRRIRHTNLIERTFGETRRRVKVIGRLPGERSCLSLVWAVLDRATGGWRGVTVSPADARLLQRLRAQLEPAALPDRRAAADEAESADRAA